MLHSRVTARQGDSFEPLTDFEPSETLRLADGARIERYALRDQRSEGVSDGHGRGTRHVLRGLADEGIEKEISVVLYERFPGFALLSVAYRNIATRAGRDRGLGEWRPHPQAFFWRGARVLVVLGRILPQSPRLGGSPSARSSTNAISWA